MRNRYIVQWPSWTVWNVAGALNAKRDLCEHTPVQTKCELSVGLVHAEPGGVTFTKIVHGCACRPRKSDFLYTSFTPNFPPISIPFSKEKHQILTKLGAFYNNLPKIHQPNLHNLDSFVSDENPSIGIPNFAKKCTKRQAHNTYTMSMWEPPMQS